VPALGDRRAAHPSVAPRAESGPHDARAQGDEFERHDAREPGDGFKPHDAGEPGDEFASHDASAPGHEFESRDAPAPGDRYGLNDAGVADDDETLAAEFAVPRPGTIGAILIEAGRMQPADARAVLLAQLDSDQPFGEIAVQLGRAKPEDIEFALARQFALPRLDPDSDAIDREVIAAFEPGHEMVERLRNLRGQLAHRTLEAHPAQKSIAVLSAERKAGRSYICANLATVFAQLGTRTLLIDADYVEPRQHRLFRLSNRGGLSAILAGRALLDSAQKVPALPLLSVITSGPRPPNPQDLLERPNLARFLRRAEMEYEVILIDTPASAAGSSARLIARAAGAAVQVVRAGRTAASDAERLSQEVAAVGSRMVGVVINLP